MKLLRSFAALAASALVVAGAAAARSAPPPGGGVPPLDSARDELRAGRAWHASRILRVLGADTTSDPDLRALLVRAEAGWQNWPAVAALLEGPDGGPRVPGTDAWLLLGRAREEVGSGEGAAAAYRTFLARAGSGDRSRAEAAVRLARVTVAGGTPAEAVAVLESLPVTADPLRSWAALESAEALAAAGDTARVVALLALVREGAARDAGWRVLPRARLAAGDSAGAYRAYLAARDGAPQPRRGDASSEAGRLALALGDSAAARTLLVAALEGGGSLAGRARAAAALLAFRDTDMGLTLRLADVLDRANDGGPALRAYDRAARLAAAAGTTLGESVRLARARRMALVASRQQEALEEFRALRASTRDPRIGARNLELWAALRRRQERTAEVATLERWLLEDYPSSPEAAELLWTRAKERDDGGDEDGALRLYAALVRAAPEHARAGEARMRTGRIHLARGDAAAAARVYREYLAEFPSGRRWDEAAFWGARALVESGDRAGAGLLVDRLLNEDPYSYYAVLGAELVGRPYRLDLPPGAGSDAPAWITEGMGRLAALEAAGLADGAAREEARLVERARSGPDERLPLAEALIASGRTVSGINLGWELRRDGAPWDRRLLGVVYPFPYRDMVTREAREWGLDPAMLAAIIRQESAFKGDIVSPAGAVGLMQVMPATGAEVAARHGPEAFRPESLTVPEVNVHLGAAFLRDMLRRYAGDLPLVLSAYNAGPARANRWRRFPEVSDPPRFTERIPFAETRGYVKNVRRNLGVYSVLYAQD